MESNRPFHVAIVGSGPGGFYAAESLLRSAPDAEIDIIERLPVPYGLVRYGVAPDHQKLKEVTKVFAALAQHERVRFIGNVSVGLDVQVSELLPLYDAVIIACGASADRRMSIPGETLSGCHSAAEFVGWYNGHPDHCNKNFDLSGKTALIVGQGNVAIDICRILAKDVDELRKTDISEAALEALSASRIRKIVVVGRRGPAHMKFTDKELRELGTLPGWDIQVAPDEFSSNSTSHFKIEQSQGAQNARNIRCLQEFSSRPKSTHRVIEFRFFLSPVEVIGESRAQRISFDQNVLSSPALQPRAVPTGKTVVIDADVIFRSIGYVALPIGDLPFDPLTGIIPNAQGRVLESSGGPKPRTYVTGWAKRGATGTIGTNRVDSIETVSSVTADRSGTTGFARAGRAGLANLLIQRGLRTVDFDGWRSIDAEEIRRGAELRRVRQKVTSIPELMSIAARASRLEQRLEQDVKTVTTLTSATSQRPPSGGPQSSLSEAGEVANEA